jgi:hypothetical protein
MLLSLEVISKIATQEKGDGTKVNKAKVVTELVLVAHQDTAVVLQPGKEPLDLPATLVTTELTPILGLGLLPVTPVWGDEFKLALLEQTVIEWVRVISLVPDEALWRFIDQRCI